MTGQKALRIIDRLLDQHQRGSLKTIQVGLELVLLLCGGDKSTQEDDILIAQTYWREYEQRQNSD
jgi:putative component of toxin-antitoxin plasmid stabilization module